MNQQTFVHAQGAHAAPAIAQGAQGVPAPSLIDSRIRRAAGDLAGPLYARVWRDFALLALQSLATGLAASLLLGLAVFAVA